MVSVVSSDLSIAQGCMQRMSSAPVVGLTVAAAALALGGWSKLLEFFEGSPPLFHEACPAFVGCGAVLFLPTVKVREIAKRLGAPFPNQFTVYADAKEEPGSETMATMVGSSAIKIASKCEKALRGDPCVKFTPEEAEGVLAHEIGHGTSAHDNPEHPQARKFFHFDTHEYDPKDPASREKWDVLFYASQRAQEREADLFTVKDPQLTKGLINRLKRAQIGQPPEVSTFKDWHPTDAERIAYLTDAVCKQTRGNDPDVCTQCFSNQTAPVPSLALPALLS